MKEQTSKELMRGSGVLLPISALPSPYGIGTLGRAAYEFVDELRDAGQSYWQVLPIGPTSYGDSPYQSFSAFAGNPYFIDLDMLAEEELLDKEELNTYDWLDTPEYVSYEKLWNSRFEVLNKAYKNADLAQNEAYERFCKENKHWINDYALFMSLKESHGHKEWLKWEEELRVRKPAAIKKATEKYADRIGFWKFVQFKFSEQWALLRNYANLRGIFLVGDIPLYTALDSADVWVNPKQFQLDANLKPTRVAGCPPDAFSDEGQKWGNPLYDWDAMEADGFKWWKNRIGNMAKMFDVIRIDHFIGIVRYYSIPVNKSAKLGKYVWGPGEKLVQAIDEARGESKIIAEDLGVVIPEVRELLKKSGYTGMKIIEFAFGGGAGNEHLPHNYEKDFAVYGGTHDNETLCGYFAGLKGRDLRYALDYCGVKTKEELVESVYRLAMESVANLCVFQMQDILKLDNAARMNFPSTLGTNWRWRMREGEYTKELREKWKRLTVITRRERVTMNILTDYLKKKYNKNIDKCSDEDIYRALLSYCKEIGKAKERMAAPGEGKRKLYYISAEFLIGKLLGNNLINLGIYDEIREELAQHGKDLAKIEELEAEASLGNGGLGRLAACFLDSISTLGLNGDGVGLNYHLGLFKQVFEKRLQDEEPNPWISKDSWLTRTDKSYTVDFGDYSVEAQMYDIDVMGYDNRTNKLHLFDLDSVNEDIVKKGISFDKKDIKRNLTLFLYPDDSDKAGNLLRVYQQYFMVSSAAQMIIEEAKERGSNLHDLNEYVAIQINDTHPSMVIPELIRLLELEGIDKKEAAGIVSKTCAYTNHTILAEALEKWPLAFIKKVAPQIVPVIKFLDAEVKKKYKDESVYIIDKENRVHMAHMDIHYGYSVNGVAYLHTEILKNTELNNFYKIYPEKFNNKTNGITFRRWLLHCNRDLAAFIEDKIGDEFKKDADKLEKLADFKNDMESLTELLDIKRKNKVRLAEYVENVQGIKIDPDSIFDIQVKRLHEYKRQQLNALYAIHEYLEIKKGHIPATPITMIFGAKAAPAYTIAKDIIHLILCLQELTTKDPQVSPYLKVIMLENYNVSYAEKVIPAADISEQISLASKEASGTGNMKFMLNGAVTLGTMDGANVEIKDLVGDDNIYIFGDDSDTVIERYKKASYKPGNYLKKDKELKACVDFIVGKEMMKIGHKKNLERLYNELVTKDWFMTFPDYEEYVKIKNKALKDYDNRYLFAQKMLINISKAGFFSSDRTIAEYNKDIWHL